LRYASFPLCHKLGLPDEAVNKLTADQEGRLAGQAMLCGGHSGFGIMIGGNSCELVRGKRRLIIRHATLRFWHDSLSDLRWMRPGKKLPKGSTALNVQGPPLGNGREKRTTSLTLIGGNTARRRARSAQLSTDSLHRQMPFRRL